MGGLLHVVQRRAAWADCGSAPSHLLAVPNVTAHPSTASVPILYDGPLLCCFNVAIKRLITVCPCVRFPVYYISVLIGCGVYKVESTSAMKLLLDCIVIRSRILSPFACHSVKSSPTINTGTPCRRRWQVSLPVISCCWNWRFLLSSMMLCLQSAFHHCSKSCPLENAATPAAGDSYPVGFNHSFELRHS